VFFAGVTASRKSAFRSLWRREPGRVAGELEQCLGKDVGRGQHRLVIAVEFDDLRRREAVCHLRVPVAGWHRPVMAEQRTRSVPPGMCGAPGATYGGIPAAFAYPAAFGDLMAAILALAAIPAVASNARIARFLVWLFNVEGTLDLLNAIVLATTYDAAPYMGPAYWIPAFWVPALLVTHYITFIVLWRHWPGPA
jgi:hypothetical protein